MKKKLILFTSLMLLLASAFAQAPQGINYQAIARDNVGTALPNHTIGIQISITDGNGGPLQYREQHTPITNQFGLFTLNIGSGTPVTGTFAAISWSTIDAWIEVGMDPAGGNSYTNMGTSQLLSVPYALYSASGGTQYTQGSGINITGTTISINAQTNTTLTGNGTTGTPLGLASQGAGTGQVLKYNGSTWVPGNDSVNVYTSGSGINVTGTTVNNNAQTNTTLTGNGTTGTPLGLAAQGAASGQVLKYNGSQWVPQNDSLGVGTIYTPGPGIDITGTVVSNNAQTNTTLTGNGTTGTPLGLAGQGAGAGQVLKYDGVQWVPGNDSVQGNIYTAGSGIDITGTTVSNNAQTDTTLTGNGTIGSPLSISAQGATAGKVLKYNGTRWAPANDSLGGDVIGTTGYIGEFFSANGIGNSPLFETLGRIGLYAPSTPDGLFSLYNDGSDDVPTLYINQANRTGNSVEMRKNAPTSVDANLYLSYNSNVLGATIESHATGAGVAGYFSGESLGGIAISATADNSTSTAIFNQGSAGDAISATANNATTTATFHQGGSGSAISANADNNTTVATITQNGNGNALELNAPIKIADGSERNGRVLTSDANGKATWRNSNIFVTSSASAVTLLSASFANETGANITITVPDSGTVLVEAMVYVQIDHTNGTDDKVAMAVGSTPTDGGSIFEQTWWSIPSVYPTFALTPFSFNVRRVFTVAAGTYTYYINGAMMSGLNADAFNYCNIAATYFSQ
jgi:hypothetical protein